MRSFRFFLFPPTRLSLLKNALSPPLDVTFDRNYLFFCRATFDATRTVPRIEPSREEIPLSGWFLESFRHDRETTKRINLFPRDGEKYENNKGGEPGSRYVHICYFGRERKNGPGSFLNGSRVYSGKMERYFLSGICVLEICKLMEDILNMPRNNVRALGEFKISPLPGQNPFVTNAKCFQ